MNTPSDVIPDSAVAAAGVESADVSYEPAGQASVDDAGRAFAARVIAFAQTVPDYEEVVDAATVPIPQHVEDYLKTSSLGAALGYFLAKNLAICRRVAQMPRAQAVRELKRLESKLRKPRLFLVHGADEARMTIRLAAHEFVWANDAELGQRVMAFAETVPDYDIVVHSCHWQVPWHIHAYFRTSLCSPEVGYYLGQHKEIYDAIAESQPLEAVAKLLSLERELAECRRLMTHGTLYSTDIPTIPTPQEYASAQRLLQLVALIHSEVGVAN